LKDFCAKNASTWSMASGTSLITVQTNALGTFKIACGTIVLFEHAFGLDGFAVCKMCQLFSNFNQFLITIRNEPGRARVHTSPMVHMAIVLYVNEQLGVVALVAEFGCRAGLALRGALLALVPVLVEALVAVRDALEACPVPQRLGEVSAREAGTLGA
jgi:hypothetical protein